MVPIRVIRSIKNTMSNLKIQTSQNVALEFEPASAGDRVVATIIDGLIQVAWVLLCLIVGGVWLKIDIGMWGAFLIVGLPYMFYHLLSEIFMNGQTLGKKAMNLRVVKLDGTQPSIGAYIMRWMFRLLDIDLFTGVVALIAVVSSEKGQRVGDIAAGTSVVKLKQPVSLDQLRPVVSKADHTITFHEASNLTDKDINTLKTVLKKWEDFDNYELVEQSTAQLKLVLNIKTELTDIDFIKTLIKDHSHLANLENEL